MSVLLVTDDSDDDIRISNHDHLYQQLKELAFAQVPLESSFSIVNHRKSAQRPRRRRPQQCLVKTLFTYMLALLFLTNHLHWSIIFLSFSSIKFMSTYASTTTTLSPRSLPSDVKEDEQQCLPLNTTYIERLCSRTCRARKTPCEPLDDLGRALTDSLFLPFCSNHTLNRSIDRIDSLSNLTEAECRQMFNQILSLDGEAGAAYAQFVTYLKAIDSASDANRYSIIKADCQQAYRTWTCSVKIPYFHRNRLIPPCQTICDEVERVCPTFRPSDREPLFAGQPLFFCNGGIVTNSNYGRRPHCFDTCHLADGSSPCHSVSSAETAAVNQLLESSMTAPLCFEIYPLPLAPTDQFSADDSISNHTRNASISASALSILSSAYSSILVNTFTSIGVLLWNTLIGRAS